GKSRHIGRDRSRGANCRCPSSAPWALVSDSGVIGAHRDSKGFLEPTWIRHVDRQKHNRTVTRYQTDLTDKEWRVIEPHLPKPCATGRPREWPMREIVNGIFYVMRAGCPWRLVPSDLPPWETIYRWFSRLARRRAL